ncbi:hypothetical protein HDU89_004625 [Geranomyces variabilis]|nr:hypothetical protein HDU89_004625 [Geranomyces variabilis]
MFDAESSFNKYNASAESAGNSKWKSWLPGRKISPTREGEATTRQKIVYLEGLRGVAALMVAVSHYVEATIMYSPAHAENVTQNQSRFWNLFYNGHWAVTIFFLLSGRVLPLGIFSSPSPVRTTAAAAFRRPFRLALPVVAASIIVIIAGAGGAWKHLAAADDIFETPFWSAVAPDHTAFGGLGGFIIYISNLLTRPSASVMEAAALSKLYPLGVIWTIPLEYLNSNLVYLFAIIILGVAPDDHRKRRFGLYAVMIFYLWWNTSWTATFFMGMVLADLTVSGRMATWRLQLGQLKGNLMAIPLLVFAVVLLTVGGVSRGVDEGTNSWVIYHGVKGFEGGPAQVTEPTTSVTISAALSLIAIEFSPVMQWIFSSPPIAFLGKISFGLYLLHGITLLGVMPQYFSYADERMSFWGMWVSGLVIFLLLAAAQGAIFYVAIDKTSVRFARWLHQALFAKPMHRSLRFGKQASIPPADDGQSEIAISTVGRAERTNGLDAWSAGR